MSEAEVLNARLRNSLRRFDARRLADNARAAAALAAIGQASVYDTHEVKDPQQLPDWYRLAGEMRDAAGQLNATIRAKDKPGATAALKRLDNSCKACHKIFAPME
ncbi:MAG TPA: cytochrome c [Pirellulales bacterium]